VFIIAINACPKKEFVMDVEAPNEKNRSKDQQFQGFEEVIFQKEPMHGEVKQVPSKKVQLSEDSTGQELKQVSTKVKDQLLENSTSQEIKYSYDQKYFSFEDNDQMYDFLLTEVIGKAEGFQFFVGKKELAPTTTFSTVVERYPEAVLKALHEAKQQALHASQPKKPLLKTFSLNASIQRDQSYFFCARREVSLVFFDTIQRPNETTIFLLLAPRASGKTSFILDLPNVLNLADVTLIYVDLQCLDNPKVSFWDFLKSAICNFFDITDQSIRFEDFLELSKFLTTKKGKFILVLDEVNSLIDHPSRDNFLARLRALRSSPCRSLLSVVAVGVYSLTSLNSGNLKVSPFSAQDSFLLPPLSPSECSDLFEQYSNATSVIVPNEVIDSIYQFTNGHPGMFCLCARKLQDYVKENRLDRVSLDTWTILLIHGHIYRLLNSYATFSRLFVEFRKNPTLAKSANERFFRIYSDDEFTQSLPDEEIFLLCDNGIVISDGKGGFRIGSPIMRNHFSNLLALLPQLPISLALPLDMHGNLDIEQLLIGLLRNLPFQDLEKATTYAYKKNEIATFSKSKTVLKEAVFQQYVISTLHRWLPNAYLTPETSCESAEADVFLQLNIFHLVIELLSNERYGPVDRRSSFLGHCKRARSYGVYLKCPFCVIHFIETDSLKPVIPTNRAIDLPSDDNILVYFFHNRSFKFVELVLWSKGGKKIIPILSETS
jgi:hypothetical protein